MSINSSQLSGGSSAALDGQDLTINSLHGPSVDEQDDEGLH